VCSSESALVAITSESAWEGLPIYEILTERLLRLERMLVGRGFSDPIPRIQFHLEILRKLRERAGVDTDETLWSLVEATELADIYCTLPSMPSRLLRQKFRAILSGPFNPQTETPGSNLARNTVFELRLAGWFCHRGIPTELGHNPDIACTIGNRRLLIQCKRPFSRSSIEANLKRACKQLSVDLNLACHPSTRGVAAISMSRALNPGVRFLSVRTEADLTPALAIQIKDLAVHYVRRFIAGPRIIGVVFDVITAAFVEDIQEYRTAQLLAFCASGDALVADRVMLRYAFLRRDAVNSHNG
jgi:hypothetical protein